MPNVAHGPEGQGNKGETAVHIMFIFPSVALLYGCMLPSPLEMQRICIGEGGLERNSTPVRPAIQTSAVISCFPGPRLLLFTCSCPC